MEERVQERERERARKGLGGSAGLVWRPSPAATKSANPIAEPKAQGHGKYNTIFDSASIILNLVAVYVSTPRHLLHYLAKLNYNFPQGALQGALTKHNKVLVTVCKPPLQGA